MDLSKLRRVSGDERGKGEDPAQSPTTPEKAPQAPAPVDYRSSVAARDAGAGPEIWLSLFVGIILMYVGRSFAQWAWANLSGQMYDSGVKWVSGVNAGQMVPYWQIEGHEALSESAMFLFGLAMLFEAVAMTVGLLLPRFWRPAMFVSLMMSILMTLYNGLAVVVMLNDKKAPAPLISLLAIGFGGYMAMVQWKALRESYRAKA